MKTLSQTQLRDLSGGQLIHPWQFPYLVTGSIGSLCVGLALKKYRYPDTAALCCVLSMLQLSYALAMMGDYFEMEGDETSSTTQHLRSAI